MTREFASCNKIVAVIPARYGSTRFPGKVLTKIAGKPMIQWVYETTVGTKVSKTLIATDDQRIYDCVIGFGGEPVMTSPEHKTGTDRIAEAVSGMDVDLVVNVQGDEPLVPSKIIDELIDTLLSEKKADMATIAVPIKAGSAERDDPNVVKVVIDNFNSALYFSRAPIPYSQNKENNNVNHFKHWGIYAFRKPFLKRFVNWPQGALECAEKLEQLRALENGARISVCIGSGQTVAVDTPADIEKVEALIAARRA